MSLDMYAEEILDHYRNPRNFGKLQNPDVSHRELNPLCGDQYEFQMRFSDGAVKEIKFNGDGCAISMASASMLTEFSKGKSAADLKKVTRGEVLKLLGISVSPARLKCAMLPLSILKACLEKRSDV